MISGASIGRVFPQRRGDKAIDTDNFNRMVEASNRPALQFDGRFFKVQGHLVSLRAPAAVGLTLAEFEFGITAVDHALGRVTLAGGFVNHHPGVYTVAPVTVQLAAGDVDNPEFIFMEYFHRSNAAVNPNSSSGHPPNEDGVTRIWLYKMFWADGLVQHPPTGWISRCVLLGSVYG